MAFQFKKRPLLLLILSAVLLVAAVVSTSGHRDQLTRAEGLLGDIVTPIQGWMYRIATHIADTAQRVQDRRDLQEAHEALQVRVTQLEQELLAYRETAKENERLRRILNYKRQQDQYQMVVAAVTGKNPGNWFNVFTIDKGQLDGVAPNSAVMTPEGLVGRVIDTGPRWSKVRGVIDHLSAVSAIVERTRDTGIVRGNKGLSFEDGMARMVHLPMDSDIVPGDRIITSGLGDIFPKGIYIGEVIEVIEERRDLYKTVIIRPASDFRRLEEVLVIVPRKE
jgi:rod shape-determining protein MreC